MSLVSPKSFSGSYTIFHEGTKHIEIDIHFIRDKIEEGIIKIEYFYIKDNEADLFNKELGRGQQNYLVDKLGTINDFQYHLD